MLPKSYLSFISYLGRAFRYKQSFEGGWAKEKKIFIWTNCFGIAALVLSGCESSRPPTGGVCQSSELAVCHCPVASHDAPQPFTTDEAGNQLQSGTIVLVASPSSSCMVFVSRSIECLSSELGIVCRLVAWKRNLRAPRRSYVWIRR